LDIDKKSDRAEEWVVTDAQLKALWGREPRGCEAMVIGPGNGVRPREADWRWMGDGWVLSV